MGDLLSDTWFLWGVALFIGLPTLVIVMGEVSQALRNTRFRAYCKPLDLFRGTALFVLFLTILLRKVVELPDTHLAVMVVDTVLWISVLNAVLALVNAIIFDTDGAAQAPKLLVDLGRLFLVAVGAALVVSYVWKVDLTGLIAALGVGSIVIGFALQDTLGNVFSGLTMLSASPFRIGSWVKIGDIEGQVRSISMRSLTLALSNGDLVDIPNASIAKDRLRVLGLAHGWSTISVELRIEQEFAPERVRAVLLQAARSVPTVLQSPGPSVSLTGLEGPQIVYSVTLYVRDYVQRGGAASEFLAFLWYIAARAGIRLQPAPALAAPATNSTETTQASVLPSVAEQLAAIGTFQVRRSVIDDLALGAVVELYRKGEHLLERKSRAEAAFVVKSGAAQVRNDDAPEAPAWTFTLGDLILFKTFFRGGDVPATVVCLSDVEVIRLPMESLLACLSREVALAQTLERMLTAREAASGATTPQSDAPPDDADRLRILETLFKG